MSYLLTEIALEMLGYKFYDTNGVHHLINFQQTMAAEQTESQTPSEEPSLMEFINQPSDTDSDKNGHDQPSLQTQASPNIRSSIKLRGTPVRALAKIMEYESDKMQSNSQHLRLRRLAYSVEPAAMMAMSSQKSNTSRRTPAKALAKIMDYENFNIRNQMTQRMEKVLKNEVGRTNEEVLGVFLNGEMKKLVKDAAEMREFRQFLEERLKCIDSRPYKTYLRTFGSE